MAKTLEQRFYALDDQMKVYFKQETLIHRWNTNADKWNAENKEYNATKKWYQRKKPTRYPYYHATPVSMPKPFPLPPSYHKDYKKAKKLIEDYNNSQS